MGYSPWGHKETRLSERTAEKEGLTSDVGDPGLTKGTSK